MKTLLATDMEDEKLAIEDEIDRLFPGRCIQRFLIVIPPDADKQMFNYSTAKRGRYWNFPPYGPGLLLAHLRDDGLKVDMLNLNDEVLKACQTSATEEEFDFDQEWMPLSPRRFADSLPIS